MSTAQPATLADTAAQFTDEILQGHREAFAALRQILAVAVNAMTAKSPAEPPTGPLPTSDSRPSDSALSPPQARTLAIALRTAMAILRKQPLTCEADEEGTRPHRNPPRPLTHTDVLNIAASQRAGKRYLPAEVVPRLKAWQEYADHMGFPAPFDFPKDLLETFPGRPERAPEREQQPQPAPA